MGGNSSGGTISGKSGGDGVTSSGIGVYLNNASNVVLRRMTINGTNQNFGIRGTSVTNFTLEFSTVTGVNGTNAGLNEAAINFGNLLGAAAITNCLIEGGKNDNLTVVNTSGTLNRLTISGSTFGFNTTTGNNNILIESQNAGQRSTSPRPRPSYGAGRSIIVNNPARPVIGNWRAQCCGWHL